MNHHMKNIHISILFGFFTLITPVSTIYASDEATADLKEQQQNLQHLLDEIENVREQRVQQKALLEKLSKKMECNWALIKDYDECDKQYKGQAQEQLTCVSKAKEKARECMSDIGE